MARQNEDGILYFPVNADIIYNRKIKLVVAEFGPKAWAVLLPLLCKIYREKGYWLDWMDEDAKLLFARDECQTDVPFVNEVAAGCIRRGIFDKTVFDMFGILTSDRIQQNFFEAKRRNKSVNVIEEFLVKNGDDYKLPENVNISRLNVNMIVKKVNISTQNKKEKEIIEGEGDCADAPHAHTKEEKELFKSFQGWISKNASRVNKMKEPLTINEFIKLRQKIPKDVLTKLLLAMQNRGDLLKKYQSAYLTILSWSKNEKESVNNEDKSDNSINNALKAAGKPQQRA